jgi:hypothetical protein
LLRGNDLCVSGRLTVARKGSVWLKLNVHGNFLIRCNAIRELNSSASLSVAQARTKLFCAEADRCEQYGAFTVIVNLIDVMFSALLSSPFGLFQCRHPLH